MTDANPNTDPPGAVAWLSPEQVELVRAISEACGLNLIGAGSPEKGRSGGVADALDTEPVDDLRSALASGETDLVLIASPGAFGSGGTNDTNAIESARARGVKIACLEPTPADALELGAGGWTRSTHGVRPIDALRVVPMMRSTRSWRDSADAIENFGQVRTLRVEALCRPEQGSLGARLHSAMGLVQSLLGAPEMVHASLASAGVSSARSPATDSLRDLHGDLCATLRFADGRVASVVASDRAPAWEHNALLLGDEGRMRLDDDSMSWDHDNADEPDEHVVAWPEAFGRLSPCARAIADTIGRLIDSNSPPDQPVDHESVLAMSQSALLSARTGQGESPEVIRRLAGGG